MPENFDRKELDTFRAPAFLTEGRRAALEQLAEGRALACERNVDYWQFAIELSHLLAAGATVNDLRWLSAEGYAKHAVEVGQPEEPARRFRHSDNLGLPAGTCFVATAAGARAAESLAARGSAGATMLRCFPLSVAGDAPGDNSSPSWDASRRILRLGRQIVKHFHVPAPAQETILNAFEEEKWPPAIDDPLPPQGDLDPKRRLRSTLESLNRSQKNRLLWFRGDGTGQRIVWEATADAARRGARLDVRRRCAA